MATVNPIIKIENGTVKYIEEQIIKQVSAKDYLTQLEQSLSVNTGILPRNCIYMKRAGASVYVMEIPARVIPIVYSVGAEKTNLIISIPFTQFYVRINHQEAIEYMFITVTKKPIKSMEDMVCVAPYPNIHSAGTSNVCTGSMRIDSGTSLSQKLERLTSMFFESGFNADLTPRMIGKIAKNGIKEYMIAWDEETKKNKFFALDENTNYSEYSSFESKIREVFGR